MKWIGKPVRLAVAFGSLLSVAALAAPAVAPVPPPDVSPFVKSGTKWKDVVVPARNPYGASWCGPDGVLSVAEIVTTPDGAVKQEEFRHWFFDVKSWRRLEGPPNSAFLRPRCLRSKPYALVVLSPGEKTFDVWDLRTGKVTKMPQLPGLDMSRAIFSADGRRAIAPGTRAALGRWPDGSVFEVTPFRKNTVMDIERCGLVQFDRNVCLTYVDGSLDRYEFNFITGTLRVKELDGIPSGVWIFSPTLTRDEKQFWFRSNPDGSSVYRLDSLGGRRPVQITGTADVGNWDVHESGAILVDNADLGVPEKGLSIFSAIGAKPRRLTNGADRHSEISRDGRMIVFTHYTRPIPPGETSAVLGMEEGIYDYEIGAEIHVLISQ